MSTSDILDFKKLCGEMGKNYNTDEEGNQVLWNDIKVIKVEKTLENQFQIKTSYEEIEYRTINIRRRQRGNCSSMELSKAYSRPPGISNLKKKDLISLCNANVIQEHYHKFYQDLNVMNAEEITEANE